MLGLRFCARAFSSCGKRGPLFIAVRGPLTITSSLAAEHRLQTLRLSSCGSRAQPLRSMWDLPRPGLEPMSPALAGRLPTTAPPGKPQIHFFVCGCPVVPTPYLKDNLRSTELPLTLVKIIDYIYGGLFLGFQFCSLDLFVYSFTNTTFLDYYSFQVSRSSVVLAFQLCSSPSILCWLFWIF